jgi:hypothetical protein
VLRRIEETQRTCFAAENRGEVVGKEKPQKEEEKYESDRQN